MPRYLALYTPLPGANQGPPDAAHMEEMGRYMTEQMQAGTLVVTGGLRTREAHAFAVHLDKAGAATIDDTPRAEWMRGSGFAVLQYETREEVIEGVKTFLKMVGGGTSEVIELMGGPPE